jgi:hypothetical protein
MVGSKYPRFDSKIQHATSDLMPRGGIADHGQNGGEKLR